MTPPANAIAAESEDVTGAPPGSELDRFLKAQFLKREDIEANRAGKLSKRELDRIADRCNQWTTNVYIMVGFLIVGSTALAIRNYMKNHQITAFILPAIFVVFSVLLYIFYVFFLRLPAGLDTDKKIVTAIKGPMDSLKVWPTKGGYTVNFDGVQYQGFGVALLYTDVKDRVMTAYVLREQKLVIAIEPVE